MLPSGIFLEKMPPFVMLEAPTEIGEPSKFPVPDCAFTSTVLKAKNREQTEGAESSMRDSTRIAGVHSSPSL